MLFLNKSTNQMLKHLIYKQALLFSQPERLPRKRIALWKLLLRIVNLSF